MTTLDEETWLDGLIDEETGLPLREIIRRNEAAAGLVRVDFYEQEMTAAAESDDLWDQERTLSALCKVGRNTAPQFLAEMEQRGLLDHQVLIALVGGVWSMAERPDLYLDHEDWGYLFATAGYTVDGVKARRPRKPRTLYRGAVADRSADWSWTDNLGVAQDYCSGKKYGRPVGQVWTASVEPWRLLARNTGRNEHEYVVDTDGMQITALSDQQESPALRNGLRGLAAAPV